MDNPQHLDWLLEGVEAWNARQQHDNFRPVFEDTDIRAAFEKAEQLDEIGRIPLERANLVGADLRRADLEGADLEGANLVGADLRRADLEGADLEGANLGGANLVGANLVGADLRRADLEGADLEGANLVGADLRRADLEGADLEGANLGGANVRTIVYSGAGTNNGSAPEYTDLSDTKYLTQKQLDSMDGDSGTILPVGLERPADWPDVIVFPALPDHDVNTPDIVALDDGRLRLADIAPPSRDDLEALHKDLREDVTALRGSGSFNNISKGFDTAFARFTGIADTSYVEMDQTRFGVQTKALRYRLEAQREEIAQIAPEKLGDLDAILMAAEMLTARLPTFQAFLAETQDDRTAIEENADLVDESLGEATETIEADPDHFDAPVGVRLREYWDTKTTEAYLAGIAMLNDAAFVVFREVRSFGNDTMTETRKIAVKGLACSLAVGMASVFAKLAGVLPGELAWVQPWLEYIPTILK